MSIWTLTYKQDSSEVEIFAAIRNYGLALESQIHKPHEYAESNEMPRFLPALLTVANHAELFFSMAMHRTWCQTMMMLTMSIHPLVLPAGAAA